MFRNKIYENNVQAASYVDRVVANYFGYSELLAQVMPSVTYDGSSISPDGALRIHTDKAVENQQAILSPNMQWENLVLSAQVCETMVTHYCEGYPQVVNGSPPFLSYTPALRLSQYPNFQQITKSIDEQDFAHAEQLKLKLGLKTGWACPWTSNDGHWKLSATHLPFYQCHTIRAADGTIRCQFIIVQGLGWYSVLPVCYFCSQQFSQQFVAFVPPKPPYSFVNEHLFNQLPNATVYLTTDILQAVQAPPNMNAIYLANLGGLDWLDGLKFSLFRGRRVVILTDDLPETTSYTMQLIAKLQTEGITPQIENAISSMRY